MNVLLLSVIVLLYLFVVGLLGYMGYRRTKDASDYMIAGRTVHPYVMAISYGATFISTSAIVGFGGAAAVFGMGILYLTFLNILVGIFIERLAYLGAARVKRMHPGRSHPGAPAGLRAGRQVGFAPVTATPRPVYSRPSISMPGAGLKTRRDDEND